MNIRLYENNEIDKDEWDRQISQCENSLIYAFSFYLDHMCPGWYALTDENKNYFMPLPIHTRAGLPYSYQPLFTQQLGIFFKSEMNEGIMTSFIEKAASIAKDINLYFNYANPLKQAKQRVNLILNLNQSFETISAGFRSDLITKPSAANLTYATSTIDEVFRFYTQFILPKNKQHISRQLKSFRDLSLFLLEEKKAFTRRIANSKGKTISTALFFSDAHRIYYLLAANSPEGRQTSANALLLYEVIRELARQQKIFDFEGSELPGVRFFFEKFGPQPQFYYHYQKSDLSLIQKKLLGAGRRLRHILPGREK